MRRSPMRCLCAAILTAGGLLAGASHAGADPRDWVPWCTGDQTPADSNCRTEPDQVPAGDAPGANPDVPVGVDPGVQAVTGAP